MGRGFEGLGFKVLGGLGFRVFGGFRVYRGIRL